MVGSELGYNAGQLGNGWENDALVLKLNDGITVGGFTPDISGSVAIIRNYETKTTYVIFNIKGDVKLENKLAGAHLNIQVGYYPGVITKKELNQSRESIQSPFINKLFVKCAGEKSSRTLRYSKLNKLFQVIEFFYPIA